MIKKIRYFWLFLIVLFWLINFSNAWYTRQLNVWWYNPYFQSQDLQINKNWTFLSQSLWITKKVFVFNDSDSYRYLFWSDKGIPYWWVECKSSIWTWFMAQWYFKSYQICPWTLSNNNTSYPSNCSVVEIGENSNIYFKNFLSSLTTDDNYFINSYYQTTNNCRQNYFDVCISSSAFNQTLCFPQWWYNWYNQDSYSWSLNLSNHLSFDNFPTSVLYDPPLQNISWGWEDLNNWIALDSEESAINYFENRYWRNKNICYVWIENMTTLYWTNGVSFQEWSWLNIFEAFSGLYWTPDLNKVYVWINTWLLNYWQWFDTSWNPDYLWTYNSWTNQVDLQFDNLTFPFRNNPVAVYFMASEIYSMSEYASQGEEVVSYCNLKINNWSYDEILSNAVKENINQFTQNYNINKWLNFDWTPRIYSGGFVVDNFSGDYWSGYYWVGWTWSSFSWNIDWKNFFDRALDKLDSAWKSNKFNPMTWILPNWIIYSLIVIILFKLLRK